MNKDEHLQHILDRLVETYSWQPAKSLWILETSWNDVAGEYIAKNTRVIGYKPKILTVAVKSSSWAQELQFFIPELKQKINELLGSVFVEDIHTRIFWKAFRPPVYRMGTGEVSVRIGRVKPRTDNLKDLVNQVETNYHLAVKQWLNEGYQPCLSCGSPTLKPYRLCSVCEKKS
ncbi:Protein of unknown function [Sulfobacillus thermosulfidooxidans DSM 9293]|uniref:DUF721 domain-containing protein n=1 Tax=Sulfobacillus thermosulfidooxidans (strain DSM 9293 / VKM B-1269 / AT-1) TaxID=929705 RepID=A0A1W1WBB0_SULTA|nr:DUF721 domain-containing protein [Sulfobacillus thermosulfidooxidans]SMC03574.1 Protein of unknown function [Sulfobacillus thermosulfidooxidans DSM 9293]